MRGYFSKLEIAGIIGWCIAVALLLFILVNPSCARAEDSIAIGWNEFSDGPEGVDYIYEHSFAKSSDSLTTGEAAFGFVRGTPFNTSYVAYSRVIQDQHLYGGIGISYVFRLTPPHLTSHYNVYFTAGIDLGSGWSFEYHHLSNAGTSGQNLGEDNFSLAYTW